MIDFSTKTYKNIVAEMLSYVSNSMDTREGSLIQTVLGCSALEDATIYSTLDRIQNADWVATSYGTYLDLRAIEFGLVRRAAIPARRNALFDIYVALDTQFAVSGNASILFKVISCEIAPNADGYYEAVIEAVNPGVEGNVSGDVDLIPSTTVAGLTYAYMTDYVSVGVDAESDDLLRARIVASYRSKDLRGNAASYIRELLSYDDVTLSTVQIYPAWKGGGTALCVVLDYNYNPLTPTAVANLQNYMCPLDSPTQPTVNGNGFAPIGAAVTISTPTGSAIKHMGISATIQVAAGSSISVARSQIEANLKALFLARRQVWGSTLTRTMVSGALQISWSDIMSCFTEGASPAVADVSSIVVTVQERVRQVDSNGAFIGYAWQTKVMTGSGTPADNTYTFIEEAELQELPTFDSADLTLAVG